MSRLLRFFSRTGLAPEDVEAEAFDVFRAELLGASLVTNAQQCLRQTTRLRNSARASTPDWPMAVFAIDPDPCRSSLNWSVFPQAFKATA